MNKLPQNLTSSNSTNFRANQQLNFWDKILGATPALQHNVPSYFPAYKRWLNVRERGRYGRLFAPQNMLLSRIVGTKVGVQKRLADLTRRAQGSRLQRFFNRLAPKYASSIRARFFKSDVLGSAFARNDVRKIALKNQTLSSTLFHMFALRKSSVVSGFYTTTMYPNATLSAARRSPEHEVRDQNAAGNLRNTKHHVSPRKLMSLSVGGRGLMPSSRRALRGHFPVVNLFWLMSVHNGRVQNLQRSFPRIGGRRYEKVKLLVSDGVLLDRDGFRSKVLQPLSEGVSAAASSPESLGECMRQVEAQQPLTHHRHQNSFTHGNMFAPASRMWRDYKGMSYVSRQVDIIFERYKPTEFNYLRDLGNYMLTARARIPMPAISAGIVAARAGRMRPKSLSEYRSVKRWRGQRRYVMRMMDWRRVWQYRRHFRYWSARNANGRRFEISRRYTNRLDNFVSSFLGARSVTYARELIKRGHVFVNGVQKFNVTLPVRQTEIVSLSKIAHLWLMQPQVNLGSARRMATRTAYYADVEDRRVVYGRHGHSVAMQFSWVHGGTPRNGGRMQFAGSMIEGLSMWRR